MMEQEPVAGALELCTILQCLRFKLKSLDSVDENMSQDGGVITVTINCQSSGLHAVLESAVPTCSCPPADQQNSGSWLVTGMAGGKQQDTEFGSDLLRSLPNIHREGFTIALNDMVRIIRTVNDVEDQPRVFNKSASMIDLPNRSTSLVDVKENKSASILEMETPENRQIQIKAETPNRFRSLDTLMAVADDDPLRMLQARYSIANASDSRTPTPRLCRRQGTYTLSRPAIVSNRSRNKTSSPIHDQQAPQANVLDNLIEMEKTTEHLRNTLSLVIRDYLGEDRHDSSNSSVLDVSKISLLKGAETSKTQYMSSPNLSGVGVREEIPKLVLKRIDSASTSNLANPPSGFKSKLHRISPNMFKLTKDPKEKDVKSKLQGLFKSKISNPVPPRPEMSPNLSSGTKKKYSHIKSTIPRPSNSKKE